MWCAAASPSRRRIAFAAVSTFAVVVALLVPTAGRSVVDYELLTAPTAPRIAAATPSSLTMTWDPGEDNHAGEFELFLDGERVGSTGETNYTFTELSCTTAYRLGVAAVDVAGGRSERATLIASPTACPQPRATPPPAPTPAPARPEPLVDPPAEASPLTPAVPELPAASEPEEPVGVPHSDRPLSATLWSGAGAFVWHETDVAPEVLGSQLRASGFMWVAVLLHDGLEADPVEGDWVQRFRAASGLPVGGWGVMRTAPEQEAELGHQLLDLYALDFYIANPEAEYKLSNDDGPSSERFERSRRFVERFRALEPDTPAAISSYCRADRADIDWRAWSEAGFAYLPQAYSNDFGNAAAPAACADGATEFFDRDSVHPTIGVYGGGGEALSPERYAALLEEAGTVGFSVYLAETRMNARDWDTFGAAIADLRIARRSDEPAPSIPAPCDRDASTTPC